MDRWLFGPGSDIGLAVMRIGLCLTLTLRLGLRFTTYLPLADQPKALFRPLSFMNFFEQMPSREVILTCLILGTAAGALATVGLFTRVALPLAWLSSVFINGMSTSQGKVIHNDLLLLLCMVPLLVAPSHEAWSLDAWRKRALSWSPRWSGRYGWPIKTAMVVIAGAYFFAGFHKVVQSHGFGWASSGNLRWILYTASDTRGPNSLALFVADHPLLSHLLGYATLLIEVGFWTCLVIPLLRWLLVPAAIGMHLGIYATMELNYFSWIATLIVVMVNWTAVVALLRRRAGLREWIGLAPARAGP